MFELLVIEDEMILEPSELSDFNLTLEKKFKTRYIGKLISSNGLCLALRSI